jgi:eukaryotic-like serine/threonine-protein kinase
MAEPDTAPTVTAPTDPAGCREVDLVALTEGRLADAEVERVMAHVDGCASCTDVMSHLASYRRPTRCGRYELMHSIGQGGMGTVWAAWDPQLRRRVAVKLVRPEVAEGAMRERMLREARALARVSHPNVIAVFDAGDHDDDVYIATELVEGDTLTVWQRERGGIEVAQAWLQVARGLAAAHAEGVVHRDVKPDNCLVGRDGRVRVGDFGLAREPTRAASNGDPHASPDDPQITQHGQVAGTPAYMAPEQRRGAVDPRSDQFALGVSLAEALTGKRPAADDAPALVDLPVIEPIVARALRGDPGERYESMDELVRALAAALAPAQPRRRGRWIAAGAAAVVVAGGAMVAALAGRGGSGPTCAPDPGEDPWTASDRARVAAVTPPNVPQRIDQWTERWRAAARAECTAAATSPLHARRARCLRDQLADVRGMVVAWAERASASRAVEALQKEIDELPEVAHCTRDAWLPAEPDARQELQLAVVRARMLGLRTLSPRARLVALKGMFPAVRTIDHAPFTVAFARTVAQLQDDEDLTRAAETLRAAASDAERLGDRARHATALVGLVLEVSRDEGLRIAQQARAELAALGGDQGLEATLDFSVGELEIDRGHVDEAIGAYERARVGYRAALGPGSAREARVLIALFAAYSANDRSNPLAREAHLQAAAIAKPLGLQMPDWSNDPQSQVAATRHILAMIREQEPNNHEGMVTGEYTFATANLIAGDNRAALEHYGLAISIAAAHQIESPQVATALARIATIHLGKGDPSTALDHARRGVDLARKLGHDDSLGHTLEAYGSALLDLGRLADAAPPFDESLRIAMAQRAAPSIVGRRRFKLAQAVWPTDPARALGFAQVAQTDLQAAIDGGAEDTQAMRDRYAATLEKIGEWIAGHPR